METFNRRLQPFLVFNKQLKWKPFPKFLDLPQEVITSSAMRDEFFSVTLLIAQPQMCLHSDKMVHMLSIKIS